MADASADASGVTAYFMLCYEDVQKSQGIVRGMAIQGSLERPDRPCEMCTQGNEEQRARYKGQETIRTSPHWFNRSHINTKHRRPLLMILIQVLY